MTTAPQPPLADSAPEKLGAGAVWALVFASIGHTLMHLFPLLFFVVVTLELQQVWEMTYGELIKLWTIGAFMVGAAALPAGWFADRWSAVGMMVVFFIGLGISCLICAFSSDRGLLWAGLTGVGLFSAIYHPVGIPWVVRNGGRARGRALGINGIFGQIGLASGALVAGGLIALGDWRVAFMVPGIVALGAGMALLLAWRAGRVSEGQPVHEAGAAQPERGDRMRAFGMMLVIMFGGSMVFQSTQAGLPELFDQRLGALADQLAGMISESAGLGALIAVVYTVGAFMQYLGGHYADKFSPRRVYVVAIMFQAPVLFLAGLLGGPLLFVSAIAMVSLHASILPPENMLLARYTPEKHQGLAFGAKYLIAFGSAPIAIWFVAELYEATGGFFEIFAVLSVCAGIMLSAALMLPRDKPAAPAVAQPAE